MTKQLNASMRLAAAMDDLRVVLIHRLGLVQPDLKAQHRLDVIEEAYRVNPFGPAWVGSGMQCQSFDLIPMAADLEGATTRLSLGLGRAAGGQEA